MPIIAAHDARPRRPGLTAELRTGRRQLRPDRPAEGGAQRAAAATAAQLAQHGFSEVEASRGESAYVVDVGPFYLASIVECLGSKALVADEMARLTGKSYYAGIAQDTIAMAVNDLITVGATPLVVQAYWAAGGSDWFGDADALAGAGRRLEARLRDLRRGLGRRRDAGAGRHRRGRAHRPGGQLHRPHQPEAAPVARRRSSAPATPSCCWPRSGIHANGLSLARKLAERLPQGYLTPIDDARPELSATRCWRRPRCTAPVTEALWRAGIAPHYAANITGHGWRKLLRHPSALTYRIAHRAAGAAGAALHRSSTPGTTTRRGLQHASTWAPASRCSWPADDAERTVDVARDQGIDAWVAGRVEAGAKQLLIEPLALRFGDDALQLR